MQGKRVWCPAKTGPGKVTRSQRFPKASGRTGLSPRVMLSPSPGSPVTGETTTQVRPPRRWSPPSGPGCPRGRPRAARSPIPPNSRFLGARQQLGARQGESIPPHTPKIVLGASAAPLGLVPSSWGSWAPIRPSPGEPLWAGTGRRGPSRAGSGPPPGAGQGTGDGDYRPPGPGALRGPARRPTYSPCGGRRAAAGTPSRSRGAPSSRLCVEKENERKPL